MTRGIDEIEAEIFAGSRSIVEPHRARLDEVLLRVEGESRAHEHVHHVVDVRLSGLDAQPGRSPGTEFQFAA